jgi:hypothetical protein
MSLQDEIKEMAEFRGSQQVAALDMWRQFSTEWDGIEVAGNKFSLIARENDGALLYDDGVYHIHISFYHVDEIHLNRDACDSFGYEAKHKGGWSRHLYVDKANLDELRDKMIVWAGRMEAKKRG